jgi:hypothetical protein
MTRKTIVLALAFVACTGLHFVVVVLLLGSVWFISLPFAGYFTLIIGELFCTSFECIWLRFAMMVTAGSIAMTTAVWKKGKWIVFELSN